MTPRRRLRLRSPPPRPASYSESSPDSGPRLGSRGRRPPSPMHERRSVMETRTRVTVGPDDAYEEIRTTRHRYRSRPPADPRERREDDGGGNDDGPFLMSGSNGRGDDRDPPRGRRGAAARPRRGERERERDEDSRLPDRIRAADEDELRDGVRRYNAAHARGSADGEWYMEIRRYRPDGSEAHRDDMVYLVKTVLVRRP